MASSVLEDSNGKMQCAVSFLSVVVLVVGVSAVAFFIIWAIEEHECPPTSFRCEEDGRCLAKRFQCDGIPHCKNGTDERPTQCNDLTNTLDFLLKHTSGCTNKDYSSNESFVKISPPQCGSRRNVIYCNNTDWTEIPWHQMDSNAYTLSLDTVISTERLNGSPLENNTLSKLYLENNKIESLSKKSLCHLDSLCWLHLSNNSLSRIDNGAFCGFSSLEWLTLSNNNLELKDFQFKGMPKLDALFLENNRITTISANLFSDLKSLTILNLSANKISSIHELAFRYNAELKDLDLSSNQLIQLHPNAFEGQKQLKKLYIGHNPFEKLAAEVFKPLESLESLGLEEIDIKAVEVEAFSFVPKLDYVTFKKFHYCRFVPKASRCFPTSDGLSSTENLLIGKFLRMTVWVVAVLTLIGNITVFVSRWCRSKRTQILDVFINNLAGADFLMGIYLFILAIKDVQYRHEYNIHAYTWTTSFLCSTIGILAMISSEVSLLILTLMSLERYLVISGPFAYQKKLNVKWARASIIIIWGFVTMLALAPAIQWQGKSSFYGSTGLCFPMHLDDPYSIGWQYTAFVFIGLNSACLILITLSYGMLFHAIRKTQHSTPIVVKDMEMALRFFLMVVTDFICWAPIIFLKVLVLKGFQIPKEIIAWVLILVLPINSAMNPFLYTFSTKDVRKKLIRLFTSTSSHAKANNTHGSYDANLVLGKGGGGTSATNSLINDTGLPRVAPTVHWDFMVNHPRSREDIRMQNIGVGPEYHEEIFPN